MHRLVLYRYLLELSSILLAVLFYLYIISGYALVKTSTVEKYTLGLIGYREAAFLHLSPITRLLLVISATIHAIAGFSLLVQRFKRTRKILEPLVIVLFTLLLIYILLIEFS
ncbi:MAG: hypothetical protein ABWW65_07540 [Thermoprotei archaeon]